MKIKNITVLTLVFAALTIALAPVDSYAQGKAKGKGKRQDNFVTICHFDGHVSDSGEPDFVTLNSTFSLPTGRCSNRGGTPIVVNENGCEGHGAVEVFPNINCQTGEDQRGDPRD